MESNVDIYSFTINLKFLKCDQDVGCFSDLIVGGCCAEDPTCPGKIKDSYYIKD